MTVALSLVALVGVVLSLGAYDGRVDRADRAVSAAVDRMILYAMGLVVIVRVWAWPNDVRKADYRPLHHRRGSAAMVGQPRPASKVVTELLGARAALTEQTAKYRAYWVAVCP